MQRYVGFLATLKAVMSQQVFSMSCQTPVVTSLVGLWLCSCCLRDSTYEKWNRKMLKPKESYVNGNRGCCMWGWTSCQLQACEGCDHSDFYLATWPVNTAPRPLLWLSDSWTSVLVSPPVWSLQQKSGVCCHILHFALIVHHISKCLNLHIHFSNNYTDTCCPTIWRI